MQTTSTIIRIAGTVSASIEDGPGYRYVLFTQGCPHNCKGCHNTHTHSFSGGKDKTDSEIFDEIKSNPLLDGLTLTGGEPFEQAEKLIPLAKAVRGIGLDVLVYSGYTFEQLIGAENPHWEELLKNCDILIDGKFILEQKTWDTPFRGSGNQRILDIPKSLGAKKAVLWEQPSFCEIEPMQ